MEAARRRVRAEPLNYAATFLFAFADLFALTSISLPYWLHVKNDAQSILILVIVLVILLVGTMDIGLLSTCLEIAGREKICYTPETIQPEWILTFLFIIIGIIALTVATAANAIAFINYPYEAQTIARFAGLVAIIFFNLAQIVFPSAFGQDQVGGTAFQLPSNFKIGVCYVFFFISHWLSVISELCAAKICRPRWQF